MPPPAHVKEAAGAVRQIALTAGKHGVTVPVLVRPRGRANGVAGVRGDALIVSVTAAPVDGAANTAVIAVLAECLQVPKSAVSIVRGHKARQKAVTVSGLSAAAVQSRLAAIL